MIDVIHEPSLHIVGQAEKTGLHEAAYMRDFWVASHDGADFERAIRDGETVTVSVGDMANSYDSQKFAYPHLSELHGLPESHEWGIGSIGSFVLAEHLRGNASDRSALVASANRALLNMYAELGLTDELQQGANLDPIQRSIGYFAHVCIDGNKDHAVFTAVGEVQAWENGHLVAGVREKEVDVTKNEFIASVAKSRDRGAAERDLGGIQRAFGIPQSDVDDILANFEDLDWSAETTYEEFRQMVYVAANSPLTHWQIRDLQNISDPSLVDRWQKEGLYYGAIDGTSTPEEFIQWDIFGLPDLKTVVLATDGLRPLDAEDRVTTLDDLESTDLQYGERTAVALDFRQLDLK